MISHFRVDALLGKGGMGVVYRAHDLQLDRPVALKFVSSDSTASPSERERLRREAQAAAKLNHPNICTVYSLGEAEGQLYIAMECLTGSDVQDLLSGGALPWRQALSICLQSARALGEAHRNKIVHKDVKSRNIFVTSQGLAKLLDFGIARTNADADATQTMALRGTPYYMAPEQIEMGELDGRCDLWALGVVLYQMLTGKLPFGRNSTRVLRSILTETPPRPSTVAGEIPSAFDDIVERALAKAVDERYPHAEAMIQDLERLSADREESLPSLQFPFPAASLEEKQTSDLRAIAVLPLINISPYPEDEYLCDGLGEELINALTHIQGVRVISRSSSFQFRGTNPDVRDIGKRLSCGLLVHGSLRRSGEALRLIMQLSDTKAGHQLWSQRFDARMQDLFALQDELAAAVFEKLEEQLGDRLSDGQLNRKATDSKGYQLYLKARFAFHQEGANSLRQALDLFVQSVTADTEYAPAWVGVAETYMRLNWYGLEPASEVIPKVRVALDSALRQEQESVPGLYLTALLQAGFDWDWSAAGKTFAQALAKGGSVAEVHFHYALDYLTPLGRLDEALAEIRCALAIDPLSPITSTAVGGCYYRMRLWDLAVRSLEETLLAHPAFGHAHWTLARVLLEQGQFDAALAHVEVGSRISGMSAASQAEFGYCYARMGRRDDAHRIIQELQKTVSRNYVSPLHFALIYAGLNQDQQALSYLQQAFEQRNRQLVWIAADPRFDSLRGNEDFRQLIARLGLSITTKA